MRNWTRLSISPSCNIPRNRSKIPDNLCEEEQSVRSDAQTKTYLKEEKSANHGDPEVRYPEARTRILLQNLQQPARRKFGSVQPKDLHICQ